MLVSGLSLRVERVGAEDVDPLYIPPPKPVLVGLLLPESGDLKSIGRSVKFGFELALDQVDWGVGLQAVRTVEIDTNSRPTGIPQSMEAFAKIGVDLVLGPVHPGGVLSAATGAVDYDVLNLSPASGVNRLTRRSCHPSVFRTAFSNDQQDHAVAQYLKESKYQKIVSIGWRNAEGEQIVDGLRRAYFDDPEAVEHSKKMVSLYQPFPLMDFSRLIKKLKKLSPDVLFVSLQGEAAKVFLQARSQEVDLVSLPVVGPAFLTESMSVKMLPEAQGVMTVSSYTDDHDSPDSHAFRALFEQLSGRPPDIYSVFGYDAGLVLVEALRVLEGEDFDRDGLAKVLSQVELKESPRGAWSFGQGRNPVLSMYLRELKDGQNKTKRKLIDQMADSAKGCKLTLSQGESSDK